MEIITKDIPINLKDFGKMYRKKVNTLAVKIEGSFKVKTKEGWLECLDGYVAWDTTGYPYPIAKSDFGAMYKKIEV